MDVGLQLDENGSPVFNSGFFEIGILQASDGAGGHEIKVRPSKSAYAVTLPRSDRELIILIFLLGHRERSRPHRAYLLALSPDRLFRSPANVSSASQAENCRRIKGVWMCFGGGGSYCTSSLMSSPHTPEDRSNLLFRGGLRSAGYGRQGYAPFLLVITSWTPRSTWTDSSCFFTHSFDRRFRIYDLTNFGEQITTFKRTEKGVEIDRMDLL
jgi:hypothetical protein